MSYCAKCGKEVPADSKFCPTCGAEVAASTATTVKPGSTPPSPLADLGSRVVAGLIDYVIIAVIAVVIAIVMFLPVFLINPYGVWMMPGFIIPHFGWFGGVFGLQFLLWLVYFTFFEGTSGQTIGKRFAHIRVVKEDGSRCDYSSALVRNVLRIVDILPLLYVIGIILIVVTDKRQRLGDMLAKTIVITT